MHILTLITIIQFMTVNASINTNHNYVQLIQIITAITITVITLIRTIVNWVRQK